MPPQDGNRPPDQVRARNSSSGRCSSVGTGGVGTVWRLLRELVDLSSVLRFFLREPAEKTKRDTRGESLCHDKTEHITGIDASERVREGASERHRWIGEGGGCGEP